jgi:hypothetical protein
MLLANKENVQKTNVTWNTQKAKEKKWYQYHINHVEAPSRLWLLAPILIRFASPYHHHHHSPTLCDVELSVRSSYHQPPECVIQHACSVTRTRQTDGVHHTALCSF